MNVLISVVNAEPFMLADRNITIPLQAPDVLLAMISLMAVKPAVKSGIGVVK